ncbi:MAG: folate family ECF transporter S component [Eubacteriales bacterium]
MRKTTLSITYCAVLIAIAVVIKIFMSSLIFFPVEYLGAAKIISISLAPAIVMFAGILLGPAYGGIAGALTDLICYMVAPAGSYFPGYTLSMALYGILPALLLHKIDSAKKAGFIRILLAAGLAQLVCSVFLNTYWMYLLTQIPIQVIWFRWISACVSWPVYTLLLFLLMKYRAKFVNPILLKA